MERNCRMCLKENKRNQFKDFLHKLSDDLVVYDYYKLFTSVSLTNQDECTKSKICSICLRKLLLFYKDRCKAITNNKIMCASVEEGE